MFKRTPLRKGIIPIRSVLGNPYYLFSIIFFLVFLLFLSRWSDLFPKASLGLLLFFTMTLILFTSLGKILHNRLQNITENRFDLPSLSITGLFSSIALIIYTIEFISNGKIPLSVLLDNTEKANFRDYSALPFLHYLAFGTALFATILLYRRYRATRGRAELSLLLLTILPQILIYNRAYFVLSFCLCFFYEILRARTIRYSTLLHIILLSILTVYLFGVAGDYRIRKSMSPLAKESLINAHYPTFFPDEFVWGYMYAASPIANLQHNIIHARNESDDFIGLLAHELVPGQSRLSALWTNLGLKKRQPKQINTSFNVSTIFTGAFTYAGWWGMILMSGTIALFFGLGIWILQRPSPYSLVFLATLCLFSSFSFFSNMFTFTPLMVMILFGMIGHLWSLLREKK